MVQSRRNSVAKAPASGKEKAQDINASQGSGAGDEPDANPEGQDMHDTGLSRRDSVGLSKQKAALGEQPDTTKERKLVLSRLEAFGSLPFAELLSEALSSPSQTMSPGASGDDNDAEIIKDQDAKVNPTGPETRQGRNSVEQATEEAKVLRQELYQRDEKERKARLALRGRRSKIREPKPDPDAPGSICKDDMGKFLYLGTRDRILELRVKALIMHAQLAETDKKPDEVIAYAEQADELAQKLDYKPLWQKCRYWKALGIMEAKEQTPSGAEQYTDSDYIELLLDISSSCMQYPEGHLAREYVAKWERRKREEEKMAEDTDGVAVTNTARNSEQETS